VNILACATLRAETRGAIDQGRSVAFPGCSYAPGPRAFRRFPNFLHVGKIAIPAQREFRGEQIRPYLEMKNSVRLDGRPARFPVPAGQRDFA